ncbi:MAG: hypothetical protein R3F60_24870 [bacterium]
MATLRALAARQPGGVAFSSAPRRAGFVGASPGSSSASPVAASGRMRWQATRPRPADPSALAAVEADLPAP